jgi:hypothetical protein
MTCAGGGEAWGGCGRWQGGGECQKRGAVEGCGQCVGGGVEELFKVGALSGLHQPEMARGLRQCRIAAECRQNRQAKGRKRAAQHCLVPV